MAKSPIEIMIDEACGVHTDFVPLPKPKARDVDQDAKALMDVGTAAVAWFNLRSAGTMRARVEAEETLAEAARVLAATGW